MLKCAQTNDGKAMSLSSPLLCEILPVWAKGTHRQIKSKSVGGVVCSQERDREVVVRQVEGRAEGRHRRQVAGVLRERGKACSRQSVGPLTQQKV